MAYYITYAALFLILILRSQGAAEVKNGYVLLLAFVAAAFGAVIPGDDYFGYLEMYRLTPNIVALLQSPDATNFSGIEQVYGEFGFIYAMSLLTSLGLDYTSFHWCPVNC